MWVWSVESPAAIVEFARRRGLAELFVHVPWNVGAPDVVRLARLVDMAHAEGLRTSALGGAPGWLDDPDGVIDRWLRPLVATNLFDRLHLDIEPEVALSEFTTSVVERFVAVVGAVAEARPAGWPLELDVRFWYPDVAAGDGDLTSALVLARGCRDRAQLPQPDRRPRRIGGPGPAHRGHRRSCGHVGAGRAGDRVLGDGAHERKQTFHGLRRIELETAITRIDAAFAGVDTYAGTAVHDWHWYRQLRS